MARRGETRQRMLSSAVTLMQRHGAAAVTVDAVLAESGAPRGSVYHHFPGGRDQIIVEALGSFADGMRSILLHGATVSPHATIDTLLQLWTRLLVDSDFHAGCPVGATALSGADLDPRLRQIVADIFTDIHIALADAFAAHGVRPDRARTLAFTCIAAAEGALMLARTQRSIDPLHDVAGEIRGLIDAAVPHDAAMPRG